MNITGNCELTEELLRECDNEFYAARGNNYDGVFNLYGLLFMSGRKARIIDDDGERVLDGHRELWRRTFADNRRVTEAADALLDALDETLHGQPSNDGKVLIAALKAAIPPAEEEKNKRLQQMAENIEEIKHTSKRIDDRTRKASENKDAKVKRRAADSAALEIWEGYQNGKYGNPVGKHRRSIRDLLKHEVTRQRLAKLGITTLTPLKNAIRRAGRNGQGD